MQIAMSSTILIPIKLVFLFFYLNLITLTGPISPGPISPGPVSPGPISPGPISPPPKATASDLLSLLGTRQQARTVNPQIAQRLYSSLKFLAPFDNPLVTPRRWPLSSIIDQQISSPPMAVQDLARILWPPLAVKELARIAVDSGGEPAAIRGALDPTNITVPDIEGANENGCGLTKYPNGWRFINEELNSYLAFLFKVIVELGPTVELDVSLSRYDLFHGHLFITEDSRRLGILFHAREYPACDDYNIPCAMMSCEAGTNVAYDDSMNLRNILWLAPLLSDNSENEPLAPGVLVVLDANPDGIIYQDLILEYYQNARSLDQDDFGKHVADINYLNVGAGAGGGAPEFQLFIC